MNASVSAGVNRIVPGSVSAVFVVGAEIPMPIVGEYVCQDVSGPKASILYLEFEQIQELVATQRSTSVIPANSFPGWPVDKVSHALKSFLMILARSATL